MIATHDWSPAQVSDNFPEKTQTRIELRPDSEREDIRYVYMADDKKTKTLTQIEYRNGVTSYVFHRADGTAREMKEFYPAAEGDTTTKGSPAARQLKSQVAFDTDGKSYVSHVTFRLDGSKERQGERTASGQYQTKWFFEDGVAVNRLRVFGSDKTLFSEDEYRKDGTLASQSRRPNSYELVTKFFNETGKLTHEFTENRWNGLSGTFYNADGTVRAKFSDSSYRLVVSYYDKGLVWLEVEYQSDRMEITEYAPNDKPLYRQVYMRVGTSGEECTATYKLKMVEEFYKWGQSNPRWNKEIKNTLIMNDEGTVALRSETRKYSWAKERTEKELRPDGSVISVKQYNDDDKVISSRPGTDADAVDVKRLTKKPAFECLPLPPKDKRFKSQPVNYYYDF
jgi:hypothetical protein